MKTFRQIKLELAASYGYSSWDMLLKGSWRVQQIEEEAVKIYATAAVKEHLSRAAENAGILQVDTEYNYQTGRRDPVYDVDRESITNIDIQLI